MKELLILISFFLLAFSQTAEPFRMEQALTAKQAALGGTAFASNESAYSLHTNPALLSRIKNTTVNLASVFNNYAEDRKYPSYSAFDSRNANEVYAASNLFVNDVNYALSHQLMIDDMAITIALSRSRVMNHDYGYRELIRQNNFNDNQIIASQIWNSEGGIYANSIGAGAGFDKLSVGFALSIMSASDYKNDKAILLATEAQAADYDEIKLAGAYNTFELALDNSPIMLRLGASYQLFDQLTIGASYASGYTAEMKGTNISDQNYDIPAQMGFGLEYYGSNELAAKFSFDFEYIAWKDFTVTQGSTKLENLYQDLFRYKFGMEHILGDMGVPLRVGAMFENNKTDKDINKTTFTLGSSVNVSVLSIDFSLAYGYLSYSERDLFTESIWKDSSGNAYTDRNGFDTVDQTFLTMMVDLSYQFDL